MVGRKDIRLPSLCWDRTIRTEENVPPIALVVSVKVLRHPGFWTIDRLVWQPQVRRTWGWLKAHEPLGTYGTDNSTIPKLTLEAATRTPGYFHTHSLLTTSQFLLEWFGDSIVGAQKKGCQHVTHSS